MKAKSLFLAALMLVSAVISVVGKDEPKKAGLAVVPVKGSEVFKVIYRGEAAGRVKLNIYNDKGENIFSESLSTTEGFIRPLNFSGLQSGQYTVELVDAFGKKSEKINYQTAKSVKNVHVSKIANEAGKFLVSVASPGTGSVTVRIYNSFDQLIHTETKDVTGDFGMIYNVKNEQAVTFEITDKAGNTKVVRF